MAEKKQKQAKRERKRLTAPSKTLNFTKSKKSAKNGRKSKSGPHLPSSFIKEFGLQKPAPNQSDQAEDHEEEIDDLYEYEESLPEEETKKNRRFDPVKNFEYELPDDFQVVSSVLNLFFFNLSLFAFHDE